LINDNCRRHQRAQDSIVGIAVLLGVQWNLRKSRLFYFANPALGKSPRPGRKPPSSIDASPRARPVGFFKTTGAIAMNNTNSLSTPELDDRIAILRGNIRQLVEQAAGRSGGQTEERNSGRIAQQSEELDRLTKERDALPKR
jgi:uncharacterized small protein (DUF1192 family)